MMNNDKQSPTELITSNKPKVVRLNKLALIILFSAGIIIMGVIISSTSHSKANNTQSQNQALPTMSDNSKPLAGQLPPDLQHVSNAVPGHQSASNGSANKVFTKRVNSQSNSANKVKSQELQQLDKARVQTFLTALDAPIAAPNDNSTALPTGSPSNSTAMNSGSSDTWGNSIGENSALDSNNNNGLPSSPNSQDNTASQNMQQQKQAFLTTLKQSINQDVLHEKVTKPSSPYELMAGSVIPAITAGGVNSDLPGQFTAIVRQNVYDTVSGRYLLIPQGTKIIMSYDSQISYAQSRLLVAAKRLIFPDGESIDLQGMPGADSTGYAGFHDLVDNHYFKIYGSAAMLGILSAGFQLSQPQQSSVLQTPSTGQIIAGAMGQQMSQVASQSMSKNLNIQPTLKIRPGYEFNVTITADMIFPGPYKG